MSLLDSFEPKASVRTMVMGDDGEMSGEAREMQEKMAEAMKASREKKDEAKIADLVEKLGLNADQEAKLREHFAKRRDAMVRLMSGQADGDVAGLLSGDGLDEFAAAELTPEQLEAYEEQKESKKQRSVESRALKDLAKLNEAIELRPDQRDAVYDALYQDAESKMGNDSPSSGIVTMLSDGLGFEIDADMIEIDGANIGGAVGGDSSPEDISRMMKERRQEKIDSQVDRLSGVLDEKQQEQYRDHLESKGSMFDAIISQ